MSKRIILLHVSIFLLGFWVLQKAIALDNINTSDADKPIEIYSTTAEFEDKKGTATYKGSVIMEQGNRHLTSDILVIQRDKGGKIESMVATGNPANFHTKTNPDKLELLGHAKIIEFYPKQDKILLFQDAELTQNYETIRGESLSYFLSTHVLSSNPISGKKTTVILKPTLATPIASETGTHTP